MGLAGIAYVFSPSSARSRVILRPMPSRLFPADEAAALKTGPWVLFVLFFFLTVAELFLSPLRTVVRIQSGSEALQVSARSLWLGATAVGNLLLWIGPLIYNACPIWVALDSVPLRLHRIDGYHVRHGEVARACHQIMLRDASQGSIHASEHGKYQASRRVLLCMICAPSLGEDEETFSSRLTAAGIHLRSGSRTSSNKTGSRQQ